MGQLQKKMQSLAHAASAHRAASAAAVLQDMEQQLVSTCVKSCEQGAGLDLISSVFPHIA